MKLASIRLQNWKAFGEFTLAFDALPGAGNTIVVEGSNGFGKTSLLEALILGLYGREGLALIGRAGPAARTDLGYDAFLERALHDPARGRDAAMFVELAFDGEAGNRFVVQRNWYFSAAGKHRRGDEEVRIWSGPDEDIVPLPDGDERASTVRSIIAAELVPARVAPFFIFDGEQLERLALADLDAQVRFGIEAALGVPLLRTLADDLISYARDRRRSLKGAIADEYDAVADAVRQLEAEEAEALARLEAIGAELEPLRSTRDAIIRRIGSLHGESYANFKQLFEERERLDRGRERVLEQLRERLSSDLALALTGAKLRQQVRARIAAEALIAHRAASRAFSDERFDQLVDRLSISPKSGLAGVDEAGLKTLLREQWAMTDPGEEPGAMLLNHLGETDRHAVDGRLRELEDLATDTIAALSTEVEQADAAVQAVDMQIAQQRGADSQSQSLAEDLRAAQEKIADLEDRSRDLARTLEAVRAELASRQRAAARIRADAASAAPVLAKADLADQLSRVVDALVTRLFPLNLDAISQAVTTAYRAMAHKDVVQTIQIATDGSVALLDRNGRDLRGRDLSAGEGQIFTLALMAAIGMISPRFPIIIDTPLARLDPDHRHNVLRFLTSLETQIIFLSQPAELSTEYLSPIADRIAGVVRLAPPDAGEAEGDRRPVAAGGTR